jgi:hypothetical protein
MTVAADKATGVDEERAKSDRKSERFRHRSNINGIFRQMLVELSNQVSKHTASKGEKSMQNFGREN